MMIEFPREIIIEEGAIERINDVYDRLNFNDIGLIISGPRTYKLFGKKIKKISKLKCDHIICKSIEKKDIEKIMRESGKYDFFIAVGGGRIIDSVKYISKKLKKEFISVPTSPSHDGIASPRATLTFNGKRYSYNAKTPLVILADVKIISSAPYRLIASGSADIVSNIIAVQDWKLSAKKGEYFSKHAAALSLMAANSIIENYKKIKRREKEGIEILIKALIDSGIAMCIAGSSRPASGSEHLISHSIDSLYPNRGGLHGEQCGVGTIIMSYFHGLNWRRIKIVLEKLGCPTTAKEIGLKDNEIINAILNAKYIREDRYTILNEINLNEKKLKRILTRLGVI